VAQLVYLHSQNFSKLSLETQKFILMYAYKQLLKEEETVEWRYDNFQFQHAAFCFS